MLSRLVKGLKSNSQYSGDRSPESDPENYAESTAESASKSASESASESSPSPEPEQRPTSKPRIRGPVQPIGAYSIAAAAPDKGHKTGSRAATKKIGEAQASTAVEKKRVVKPVGKPERQQSKIQKKPKTAEKPKEFPKPQESEVDESEESDEEFEAVESEVEPEVVESDEEAEKEIDEETEQATQATQEISNSPLLGSSPPAEPMLDNEDSVTKDEPAKVRRRKTKSLPFQDSVIFSEPAPPTALEFDKYDKNDLRDHYLDWAVQHGFAVHIRKSNDKPLMGAVFVRLTCKENRVQRDKSKRNPLAKPCPWSLRLNKKVDKVTGKVCWVPHQVCSDHNHERMEDPTELVAYRKLFKRTYAKSIQESINAGKSYHGVIADLQKHESLKRIKARDIPISKKDVFNAKAALKTGRSVIFPVDG